MKVAEVHRGHDLVRMKHRLIGVEIRLRYSCRPHIRREGTHKTVSLFYGNIAKDKEEPSTVGRLVANGFTLCKSGCFLKRRPSGQPLRSLVLFPEESLSAEMRKNCD